VSVFNPPNGRTPRELALEILIRVDEKRSYADRLLDATLTKAGIEPRDRALLTELVYGTLRWRGRIDWVAQRFVPQPLANMKAPLRNVLRLTLYQVLFLNRVPEYAAVNEGVELAKRRSGQRGGALLNAVVRRVLREKDSILLPAADVDPVQNMAVLWSHPEWLVRLWQDYLPDEDIAALLGANNQEAPIVLRVNSLRADRARLLQAFDGQGVKASPCRWSAQGVRLQAAPPVGQLPGYPEGLLQVQGEASQMIAWLLDPQPQERVLDACAAPGGKLTHLAELMRDEGELVALDASARGLEKVRENVGRLGLRSIRVCRCDVTRDLPKDYASFYDRILVDAPCTALGTLRSHPEAKWQRQLADVKRLAKLQGQILQSVARYLKPGGVLVYATCTLTPDENEGVVSNFLQREATVVLEDARTLLPKAASTMTRGKYFLSLSHKHDTDGFFAARMRKVAG
jgi:16S rRNA (cytosine967-C5)-methyltransferase